MYELPYCSCKSLNDSHNCRIPGTRLTLEFDQKTATVTKITFTDLQSWGTREDFPRRQLVKVDEIVRKAFESDEMVREQFENVEEIKKNIEEARKEDQKREEAHRIAKKEALKEAREYFNQG